MTKKKLYRYIGRNGIITSPVILDNFPKIDLYQLVADEDKILTDGDKKVKNIIIEVEELNEWKEISDIGQK